MNSAWLLLIAAAALLSSVGAAKDAPRTWLALVLAALAAALAASGISLWVDGGWEYRSVREFCGEPIHFVFDRISAWFLALLSIVGGAAAVYAREYWADQRHPRSARSGRIWWSILLLCLGSTLVSANGLHFLISWELFTLSAYFLVTLDRQRGEVRAAGWLYLGASHVATLALFAMFAALAARTGGWDLGPMPRQAGVAPLFWLALVGFGLKAGMFPLHVWLPSAHANAPSHVSAILSGVTIKMGIYGLVRFSGWMPVPESAGWVVTGLGAVSAILGVAFALAQHDLKRLLAYHSVENIGIILIGLGFALVAAAHGDAAWGRLALAGGLLHVWNHGCFKALLFLGAGSVLHATGTREMSRLGGLWRTMPWTAALFALGAVAITGLPPLNGFVSEWLIYLGLLDAAVAHHPAAAAAMPAAIVLSVTGALALACFVKVCGVVFLGAPRTDAAAQAHESGALMRGAMLVLAGACSAIGLAPVVFWHALAGAVNAWRPTGGDGPSPAPLALLSLLHGSLLLMAATGAWYLWRRLHRTHVARGPTWDCGYANPNVRMQYTAGSFAQTITQWFAWILKPERHAHLPERALPSDASLTQHTPDTVLARIVRPAADAILNLSEVVRGFQHGRVQAYIFYLVIGLAAAAALVLWGGAS